MKSFLHSAVFIIMAVLFFPYFAGAAEKTLSVSSKSVVQGEVFSVDIILNDASGTAGASFTVIYDKTVLTLENVKSTFFGSFAAQNISPAQVVVEGKTYTQPLLVNEVATGAMIAAARKDNGDGNDVAIFTLDFSVTGAAPAGSYQIAATESVINNESAGYSADGETVPMLAGIDGTSYVSHTVSKVPGTVTVSSFADSDQDGIDDNWEKAHVPTGTPANLALSVFSRYGDFDNDGYTDFQEYANRGISDPEGVLFDPTVKNASGGVGYSEKGNAIPAIQLLLEETPAQ